MLVAIAAGGFLHLAGAARAGDVVWAVGIMVTLVPLTWSVFKSLLRRDVGVDAIALVAMVGALALGEYLAGTSSPSCWPAEALEASPEEGTARADALVQRPPRTGHRRRGDTIQEVAGTSCCRAIARCLPAEWYRSTAWSSPRRPRSTSRP